MIQDLDLVLGGGSPARGKFKDFADIYFMHRDGPTARAACDFHARRLRGLANIQESFWPPQRAPGWFQGNDEGWIHLDGTPGKPGERPSLDNHNVGRNESIVRIIHLPRFSQHRSTVGVSSAVFPKSACALMNVHQTGAKEAIFGSSEAGRSWPFLEDLDQNSQTHLAHPLEIAGPTIEIVLNRIAVDPQELVSTFTCRVNEEQKEMTTYAHAPLYAIRTMLESEQIQSGPENSDVLDCLFIRQVFNWLPGTASKIDNHPKNLKQLQLDTRSNLGLKWNCGFEDEERMFISATWDCAQLRATEVAAAADVFARAVEWFTTPENWDRTLGDCELIHG